MNTIERGGVLKGSFALVSQIINLFAFLRQGSLIKSIFIPDIFAAAKSGTFGVADISIRFVQFDLSIMKSLLWNDRNWN